MRHDETNCRECGATDVDWLDHVCKVTDLPTPLISQPGWSIRETPVNGRALWKHYVLDGAEVAYSVGAVWGADRGALESAVFAAEEEMACLMAAARKEFGF